MRITTLIMLTASLHAVAAPGQENALLNIRHTLTLEGARSAMAAAMAEARKIAAPGAAIAVVDEGGHVLCVERMDGTFAAAWRISIGKARTAAVFGKPTSAFEKIIRDGRTPMLALEDFTPLQGGVPIVIEGRVVGAIGVSGAASAQQDEELALAGAGAAMTAISVSTKNMQGEAATPTPLKVGRADSKDVPPRAPRSPTAEVRKQIAVQ